MSDARDLTPIGFDPFGRASLTFGERNVIDLDQKSLLYAPVATPG
jgi:hypothetical protein